MEERKSHKTAILLSFFAGYIGLHRFYTGHTAIGIVQLFTFGCCGIWSLVDFILLCFNNFQDSDGNKLEDYNPVLSKTLFGVWIASFALGLLICTTAFLEFIKSIQGA